MNEARPGTRVADLEPQALGEEPLRGLLVQGADDHVPEPARPDPACPLYRRGPAVGPLGSARSVGRLLLGRSLGDARTDLDADVKRRVRITHPQARRIALEVHLESAQARLDPAYVVKIIGADADLQQLAPLSRPQRQLLAAVGGGENQTTAGSVANAAQPEVLVVGRDRVHVRDAQGYRRQTVQAHRVAISFRADPGLRPG